MNKEKIKIKINFGNSHELFYFLQILFFLFEQNSLN